MTGMIEECLVAYRAEVDEYVGRERLQAREEVILSRLGPLLKGRAVLDLGVGAGRTTPHLLTFTDNYTGVDISPDMIATAAQRFPGATMEMDAARALRFEDGAFDLVLFSFNGIDHADHADRLRILS